MVKSSATAAYCFVSGQTEVATAASSSSKYVLTIRQQPQRAKLCGAKERDRRPIDPPPIIQIKLANPASDRNSDFLQSPYLFVTCNLVHADDPSGEIVAPAHRALAGTVVSSLNRLKDVDNSDGGFFVFGDISARIEGRFRLRFNLFELVEGQVVHIMSMTSNPLTVFPSKTFPGMSESTFLSRSFSDQGVRIRIRKDHHVKPKRPLPEDTADGSLTSMHSPPSSCHEADHSDDDTHSQPRKRSRPAQDTYSTGGSHPRPVMIASRPKHYSPMEPLDRTPPSSPGSFILQDPYPSRPYFNPHALPPVPSRHDSHLSYPSPFSRSQTHHQHFSSNPGPITSRDGFQSDYHSPPSRPHATFSPDHEHTHSLSAGPHGMNPSLSSNRPLHHQQTQGHHSPLPSSALPYQTVAPHPRHLVHHGQGYHEYASHRYDRPGSAANGREIGRQEYHQSYAPHRRTPSVSSQHSDGSFSPPHPISPPPHSTLPSLPSILPSFSNNHEKVRLPPIHTLDAL